MSAVFSHGRLRLYLLKVLAEEPRHGYELIRLLENRFYGLYAPSAGTIYPRLARMEADGLITHTAGGGRKVYDITEAGRQELTVRATELATLEAEIHASVADLTALAEQVEEGVRGSVRDLKRELRSAKDEARGGQGREQWREARQAWRTATGAPSAPPATVTGTWNEPRSPSEVAHKADELAAEVRWLLSAAPPSAESLRLAANVLDSVRDQLRHLLRG